MSERLSLFPMNRDLCAVARYATLLQGYDLTHLLMPKYLRMGGEDVSRLDGGTHVGLQLTDYNKDRLMECDVLYMDYDETIASENFYKEIFIHAREMGVEVIPSNALKKKFNDIFDDLFATAEVPFEITPADDFLYDINIPVITVLSHGPCTDQLAVELALRQHFVDAGYNVGQIGSHDASKMFGFLSMPEFMLASGDTYEKTVRFNRYIKDLVSNEQFEILVLGAPGAIVKYNNRLLQGLGVLPSAICNAVRSDVSIVCTYCGDYKNEYFSEISQFGEFRLGSPIYFYNVANTTAAPDISKENNTGVIPLTYTNVDSRFVLSILRNVKSDGYHLFNALDNDSVKEACIAVQNALSGNTPFMR